MLKDHVGWEKHPAKPPYQIREYIFAERGPRSKPKPEPKVSRSRLPACSETRQIVQANLSPDTNISDHQIIPGTSRVITDAPVTTAVNENAPETASLLHSSGASSPRIPQPLIPLSTPSVSDPRPRPRDLPESQPTDPRSSRLGSPKDRMRTRY